MPEGVRRRFCPIKRKSGFESYQPESRKKLGEFETRSQKKTFRIVYSRFGYATGV